MKSILTFLAFSLALLTTSLDSQAKQTATEYAQMHQGIIATSRVVSVIKKEIDKVLDYDVMIKDSLGSSYDLASHEQQQQAKALLQTIIRTNLCHRLFGTGPRITWLSEEQQSQNQFLVHSIVSPKPNSSDEPLKIDYVIRWSEAGYKITDVLFEDVSTVKSYRSQFSKIIYKDGIDVLINKLREKVKKLSIDDSDGC